MNNDFERRLAELPPVGPPVGYISSTLRRLDAASGARPRNLRVWAVAAALVLSVALNLLLLADRATSPADESIQSATAARQSSSTYVAALPGLGEIERHDVVEL